MKKNPILMKATKGAPIQMNYNSPMKVVGLAKLGLKALSKAKNFFKSGAKKYTNKNPYDLENYGKTFNTRKKANQNIFGFDKGANVKKGPYRNEHGFLNTNPSKTKSFGGFSGKYNN